MAKEAVIQVRIDADLKEQVEDKIRHLREELNDDSINEDNYEDAIVRLKKIRGFDKFDDEYHD